MKYHYSRSAEMSGNIWNKLTRHYPLTAAVINIPPKELTADS